MSLLLLLLALGGAAATRFQAPPKPILDCSNLPVGVHGMPGTGCSIYYFICLGRGRPAKKLQCPQSGIFDKAQKVCKPANQVAACKALLAPKPLPAPKPFAFVPRPAPQQSPPAFQGYGQPRPKPLQPKIPSSGKFDCSAKQDGDYADGCSHIYFSCRAGQAVERTCALTALKFDSLSGQCGMSEFVTDCGGSPKVESPPEEFPLVEKDSRCAGLPSGIFEMPGASCSPSFLSCNDGFGEEMSCATPGLAFDIESGMCMGQQYVAACGGEPTPVPEPVEPSTRAPIDPSISCAGKQDGDFPIPNRQCAYGFFSCSGGVPELRRCPGELRFDGTVGICEEQQFIQECGGAPRPQQEPTTTHAPLVPDSEFSCAGKPDGLFDDHYGCSKNFYACSGGKASKFTCAGEMAYDPESERCVSQDFVKACGGVPTPAPEIVDDAGTPLPPPDVDFDCDKTGDGPQSIGCAYEYVVCSFGRPYPKKCASKGLRFDQETFACQPEDEVRECGGQPKPKPTQAPFKPPTPVAFDCSTKNDGIYENPADPCDKKFFTCSSGTAAELSCPEGLSYNPQETACIVKPSCAKPLPQAPPQPRGYGRQQQAPPAPKPAPVFRGYGQPQQAPPPAPKPAPPRVFQPKPAPRVFRGYGQPQAPKPAPVQTFQFQPRKIQQAPRSQPLIRPAPKVQTFVPRPRPQPQAAPQFFKPISRPQFSLFQGLGYDEKPNVVDENTGADKSEQKN